MRFDLSPVSCVAAWISPVLCHAAPIASLTYPLQARSEVSIVRISVCLSLLSAVLYMGLEWAYDTVERGGLGNSTYL